MRTFVLASEPSAPGQPLNHGGKGHSLEGQPLQSKPDLLGLDVVGCVFIIWKETGSPWLLLSEAKEVRMVSVFAEFKKTI